MNLNIIIWGVAPVAYGLLSAAAYMWVRPAAIPSWGAYFKYAIRFIAVAYLLLFLKWFIQ